jgi:hypothetical protein
MGAGLMWFLVHGIHAVNLCRGVAKLVKASDFDSDMRGFESFLPCQISCPPADAGRVPFGGLRVRQACGMWVFV